MTITANLPAATALSDHATAINFALDHLEPFEVAEFLRERREGKDLTAWLEGVQHDRHFAEGLSAA